MTDREKHLSLALDSLAALSDSLIEYRSDIYGIAPYHEWRQHLTDARRNIEAAAIPKPSVLRRWFGRTERKQEAA